MNYHIARAVASLCPKQDKFLQSAPQQPAKSVPIPVAVARPLSTGAPTAQAPPHQGHPATAGEAVASPDAPPPEQTDAEAAHSRHFQKGLGSYPLRSSAFLVTLRHRPHDAASLGVRDHGCTLAASAVSADPRTHQQAIWPETRLAGPRPNNGLRSRITTPT
eukprot:1352365-Pleurochrysis_carterae.AAC.2